MILRKLYVNNNIKIINRQVDKLTHLIDDLLDISRITQNKIRLQKKRINLSEAVEVAI